jgi:hypothetical protein
MKKCSLLTILFFLSILAYSQDYENSGRKNEPQTIAGGQSHFGAFGALGFKASEFNGKNVMLAGVRGGIILNRSVAMGFEGYGLIPSTTYNRISNFGKAYAVGGYGGFFVEPVFFSNHVVHFTLPVSAGAGWLGYIEDYEDDERDRWDDEDDLIDGDVMWYIEPGISAEVNVTRWFRIAGGYSRRFTQDLDLYNTSSNAFSTNNYSLTFKFGRF